MSSLAQKLAAPLRAAIFWLLPKGVRDDWVRRSLANDVGFFGHGGSALDRNLKPLGRFARWLLRPTVEVVQEIHRHAFRESCMEVLGEDPDDWGTS